MKEAQERVRKWMKAVKHLTPIGPLVNCHDAELALFRRRLHREEAVVEFFEAAKRGHIVGIADALADSLVVILGTACAYGIEIAPIFEEVMRSNDTKLMGLVRRADGKILKGPAYRPPDLAPILARQARYGASVRLKGEKIWLRAKVKPTGQLGGKAERLKRDIKLALSYREKRIELERRNRKESLS